MNANEYESTQNLRAPGGILFHQTPDSFIFSVSIYFGEIHLMRFVPFMVKMPPFTGGMV